MMKILKTRTIDIDLRDGNDKLVNLEFEINSDETTLKIFTETSSHLVEFTPEEWREFVEEIA